MFETPTATRVFDLVEHWARTTPDAPAWAFNDDTGSYSQLLTEVRAAAKAMIAAGVRNGDRVAMLTTPRPEFWHTFLAAGSIGAVWVGLNPRYQVRELEHVIRNSRPSLLIALDIPERQDLGDDLRSLAETHDVSSFLSFGSRDAQWQDFIAAGSSISDDELDSRQAQVTGDDPALIVYTSGSTGAPKGAVLGHRGLCASFRLQADHHPVEKMRVIANLPVNHIGGVGDLCCTPLTTGGLIVFQEGFDPDAVFDAIEKHQITSLMQVPTTLKILTEHPRFATADLSSLQGVFWGGGPLPLHVIQAWRPVVDSLGVTYGMTEITGSVTYSDDDASDEELSNSVGRPVAEIDVRLVGENGEDVDEGEQGEVWVRHPGVLLEYFDNPDATAAAFTGDGFFRTGDIGIARPDGNFRLVGRMTEMYKSGGYNVYPREIELTLEAHPAVRMAAVVGVPDDLYQEVGYAWIEADDGAVTTDELKAWCKDRLANYKVPKTFRVVDALPLLPIGKVDKKALQARSTSPSAEATP